MSCEGPGSFLFLLLYSWSGVPEVTSRWMQQFPKVLYPSFPGDVSTVSHYWKYKVHAHPRTSYLLRNEPEHSDYGRRGAPWSDSEPSLSHFAPHLLLVNFIRGSPDFPAVPWNMLCTLLLRAFPPTFPSVRMCFLQMSTWLISSRPSCLCPNGTLEERLLRLCCLK